MRHTEESIKRVKKSLAEMWLLVQLSLIHI